MSSPEHHPAMLGPLAGDAARAAWTTLAAALADHRPPCATAPEEWFPDRRTATPAALAACAACPARQPCRHYALTAGERHGLWGGLDAERHGRDP